MANRQRVDAPSGSTDGLTAAADLLTATVTSCATLTDSGSRVPAAGVTTVATPERDSEHLKLVFSLAAPLGPLAAMSRTVQGASMHLPVGSVTR